MQIPAGCLRSQSQEPKARSREPATRDTAGLAQVNANQCCLYNWKEARPGSRDQASRTGWQDGSPSKLHLLRSVLHAEAKPHCDLPTLPTLPSSPSSNPSPAESAEAATSSLGSVISGYLRLSSVTDTVIRAGITGAYENSRSSPQDVHSEPHLVMPFPLIRSRH